ncbi:MAG: FTR1 family protein [Spirochaetota bacterium]
MSSFLPGMVVGFREGLEAFLVVAVALRFLDKTGRGAMKRSVWGGAAAGVVLSVVVGLVLFALASFLGGTGRAARIWESGASLVAVVLVSTFIVWMIKHGAELKGAVERSVGSAGKGLGIGAVVAAMVLREGVEIALFSYAGTYSVLSLGLGIVVSLLLVILVFMSLIKADLAAIFNITLAYLMLQAGFLLGYGIHEGLSALKDAGVLAAGHPVFMKAFDVSATVFDHKAGPVGVPLYALVGWYSRPEWVQFIVQYLYTAGMFGYWLSRRGTGWEPRRSN